MVRPRWSGNGRPSSTWPPWTVPTYRHPRITESRGRTGHGGRLRKNPAPCISNAAGERAFVSPMLSIVSFFSKAYGLGRLATGLRAFLRHPISLEEARAIVKRGMQRREAALLEKLEGAVFGNPRSPYLALFRNAGCGWEDVREVIEQDGVEGALERFLKAGVYVTFEEFKGRKPA